MPLHMTEAEIAAEATLIAKTHADAFTERYISARHEILEGKRQAANATPATPAPTAPIKTSDAVEAAVAAILSAEDIVFEAPSARVKAGGDA